MKSFSWYEKDWTDSIVIVSIVVKILYGDRPSDTLFWSHARISSEVEGIYIYTRSFSQNFSNFAVLLHQRSVFKSHYVLGSGLCKRWWEIESDNKIIEIATAIHTESLMLECELKHLIFQ